MQGRNIYTNCEWCLEVVGFDNNPYENHIKILGREGETMIASIRVKKFNTNPRVFSDTFICPICLNKILSKALEDETKTSKLK